MNIAIMAATVYTPNCSGGDLFSPTNANIAPMIIYGGMNAAIIGDNWNCSNQITPVATLRTGSYYVNCSVPAELAANHPLCFPASAC